ncbi:MAG TPA: hypothetical protein PLX79_02775 [Candidatus Dojkabacteria bacterium]|nr:hypothetical protein [Candidatus Dojkabacteria bacterium]
MRDSKIIRFIVGILILLLIIVYPIGKILTDPVKVNSILDKVNFEKKFITIFTEISVKQLSSSTGQDTDEISESISKDIISEEELKLQRVTNVENFYNYISLNKVPIIKFEIQNPVSALKDKFTDTASGIVEDVKNFEICSEDSENWFCNIYNNVSEKIFSGDSAEENNEISINPDEIIDTAEIEENFPNYELETSLGINENNINQINQIYRILRYGPDILLAIIGVLAFIGYITTFPSTKYSFGLFIDVIKADVFALIIWILLPLGIKVFSPFKIETGDTSLTPYINDALGSIFFEVAKVALIVPVILTAITLFIWFITAQVSRSRKIEDQSKKQSENRKEVEYEEDEEDEDDNDDVESEDTETDPEVITKQEISKADNQLDTIISEKDNSAIDDQENGEIEEQE